MSDHAPFDLPHPHIEALPRFNVLTLDKQYRAGERWIYWYDQDGMFVGVTNTEFSERGLGISYAFNSVGYTMACKGEAHFELKHGPRGAQQRRPAIICPGCGKQKEIMLFFDGWWRCSKCHGVRSLTTHLDQPTKDYLRMQELRSTISAGRLSYQRHASHQANIEEYEILWLKVGNSPRSLRAHQNLKVWEEYVSPDEGREFGRHPTYGR